MEFMNVFTLVSRIMETRMWWSLTNQSEAPLEPADQCGTPLYRHVPHAKVSSGDPTQQAFSDRRKRWSYNLDTVTNAAAMTFCIENRARFPNNVKARFVKTLFQYTNFNNITNLNQLFHNHFFNVHFI